MPIVPVHHSILGCSSKNSYSVNGASLVQSYLHYSHSNTIHMHNSWYEHCPQNTCRAIDYNPTCGSFSLKMTCPIFFLRCQKEKKDEVKSKSKCQSQCYWSLQLPSSTIPVLTTCLKSRTMGGDYCQNKDNRKKGCFRLRVLERGGAFNEGVLRIPYM